MADFDSGPLLTNHVPPGKSEVFFTDSSSDDARDRIRPGPELDQDPFEGLLAGQEGHRPRTSRKKSDDEALVDQLEYKVSESSISTDQRPTRQSMTKDSRWSSAHRAGDINLADVDDIENEVQKVAVTQPRIPMQGSFGSGFSVDSKPIDEQTAIVSVHCGVVILSCLKFPISSSYCFPSGLEVSYIRKCSSKFQQ